tara:strand:- start:2507 stop:5104 length:2598 start_codon:yes stop_codon:yes gene_type:complete
MKAKVRWGFTPLTNVFSERFGFIQLQNPMDRIARLLFAAFTVALFPLDLASAASGPDFEKEVKPILESACLRCHGTGKEKGGLQLHSREAMMKGGDTDTAVVEGDPEHSLLIERIVLPISDDEVMPQETDEVLPQEQIDVLKRWVAAGAPWPEGIRLKAAKQKLTKNELVFPDQAPKNLHEVAQTIDRVLEHENERRGALKGEQIDDMAFLRRATVDLVGIIPTIDDIREYQSWPAAERREKQIDKLLNDERFADRWMVFYSDMLRVRSNARGGRELQAWIHQCVSENVAWDKMAYELISASGRTTQNPAVGFLLGDGADPMNMAAATSQIFLGVRLACAQCHDHPFDDWNQMEFYEMASFFGKSVQRDVRIRDRLLYTKVDEEETQRVQWPPEREQPSSREPVKPRFPFELVSYQTPPHFINRFNAIRQAEAEIEAKKDEGDALDTLLDLDTTSKGIGGFDVLSEAKKASEDLNVYKDLHKESDLRQEVARMVTSPRNTYFSRSFVNRIWAELNGQGFVEPLDNFSEFQALKHPQTIEYISREFIASGFDLKTLIKMIMLTETYSRGHLGPEATPAMIEIASKNFTASPVRRMIGESIYDSVVQAGHVAERKWRQGENVRLVTTQIRIPISGETSEDPLEVAANDSASMGMTANMMNNMQSAGAGYDLESGIEIDFKKVLSDAAKTESELDSMKAQADAMLAEQERMRMMAEQNRRRPQRYQLKTIQEEKDDNPSFSSTMRMASPAPADHFVRVFGQPSRAALGEFREQNASLRQQLMMLNGKATHEAARVGTLEPLHNMVTGPNANIDAAINHVYLECLTREPTAEEFADAKAIVGNAGEEAVSGMSDLRWALLNCHEFRFLP